MSPQTKLKFGFLALPDFQYFPRKARLPFDLSEGVQVLAGPLKDHLAASSIRHWADWLGSLDWESVEKRRAYLQVVQPSSDPLVNNQENIDLHTLLHDAYLALMVCAPLRSQVGYPIVMTGVGTVNQGRVNAEIIQGLSRYHPWVESHYMYKRGYHVQRARSYFQGARLLNDWRTIFQQMRKLRRRKRGNLAMRLAVESLKNGLETNFLDFRVPLFVRACEAVMALKRNQQKAVFVERAAKLLREKPKPLFVSPGTKLEPLLEDIWEIRNSSVHGMPFGWKIKGRVKSERRVSQHAYLAEECARRSLRFALGNEALIRASANRAKLEDWCASNW